MALFKRKSKRIKTNEAYQKYFATKKKRGELKSALTLANWIKAGKPKPILHTRGTKKVKKRIGSALTSKELARFRTKKKYKKD